MYFKSKRYPEKNLNFYNTHKLRHLFLSEIHQYRQHSAPLSRYPCARRGRARRNANFIQSFEPKMTYGFRPPLGKR